MKRWLTEPLLHFVLLGVALFGAYRLANPRTSETDRRIVVLPGRIEQLAAVFAKTWQRPPTADELRGLVDNFVLEEVYYREALAMGIDRDDTMIRRRLRQKLEFLTDDASALLEPSDEDLEQYLAAHPATFREDPIYTFQQLFYNPEHDGVEVDQWVTAQLAALKNGEVPKSHPTLLPERLEHASQRAVASTFGAEFAQQLDDLETGEWQGPIRSSYGLHLVRLGSRTPGRIPRLDEVRDAVAREWANERRLEFRQQFDERILEKYEVIVEWPSAADPKSEGGP